ncbi:hypothetical protein HKD37_01G001650 [Glycine soja]
MSARIIASNLKRESKGEVIQLKIESAIDKGDEPILLELRLEQLAAIINKYSSNQCPRLFKITPLVATLKKSSHDGLLEFQALLHSQLTKKFKNDPQSAVVPPARGKPFHPNFYIKIKKFVPSNDTQKEETPEMVAEEAISADDKDTETLAQEKTEVSAAPPALQEKNGHGSSSSRSPSPPPSKGNSQATTGETFKTPVSGTRDKAQPNLNHQNAPNTSEKVKPKENTIPVSECMTNENKGVRGLHPSFREIRKSLARELIILQERLDSIIAKKRQQQMPDADVQEHVEITLMNMQSEEHVQKQQEEKVAVPEDSAEGTRDDVKGPCANDGGSESQSPVDPPSNEGAESVALPNGSDNEDTSQVVASDALNSSSDLSESDKMAVESEAKSEAKDNPIAEDIPIEVDKLDKTVWEELPVGVIDEDINDVSIEREEHDDVRSGSLPAMVNDSAQEGSDSENYAMMELPLGLHEEHERDNEMNISNGETRSENEIFIEELPVGLHDEDTAISKDKRDDQAKPKTYKEVLLAQEGECNADEETSSSTDDTANETQLEQQQKLKEQEKVHSSRVKIEYPEEGELNGDAPMDIRVECKSGEEAGTDTKLLPLTTQVSDNEPENEDVFSEANYVNNKLTEPMEFVPSNDTQKEETPEMVAEGAISADDKYFRCFWYSPLIRIGV